MSDDEAKEIDERSQRIDELGKKSGQVLVFLSFAMVSVAIKQSTMTIRR